VVEAADVIIEVLDARDPLSCRCLDVERFVRRAGAAKKIVLLLNKIGAPWSVAAALDPPWQSPPRARCSAGRAMAGQPCRAALELQLDAPGARTVTDE
jgi:hypothetical protein